MPLELEYLWLWFCDLSMGLTPAFGPPAPTWGDIGSWAQLAGIHLEPWEARMLALLGIMRANAIAKEGEKPNPNGSPKPN
jgi:hypothetical protein